MMNKTHLSSVILAALYPISHNNTTYQAGELLEVSADDAVFLRLSKCVREPTSDELKAYQKLQNPMTAAPVNNGTDDNELPQRTTATDVSESKPAEVVETELVVETIEAVEPETIEAVEPAEVVKSETSPEAVTNPYDGWLKKDLNAELDKRGIEHEATARNDDLEALLLADDTKLANAS